MRAGIVIDAWKLVIFEAHLQQAGYHYEQGALAAGTIGLYVETDDHARLETVVRGANEAADAARNKR